MQHSGPLEKSNAQTWYTILTKGGDALATYTVQPNDTLTKIAQSLGIDAKALAQLNNISDPGKIKAGQILTLPLMTTDLQGLSGEAGIEHGPVINRQKFRLPTTEYANEKVPKDMVMLHFTASSSAQSVYNAWMQLVNGKPYRVATAYVVDLDGAIYEFFPPEKWAWHLGMTSDNPNSINDSRAVAIEIVNVGALKEAPGNSGQLNWWPNNYTTRWCAKEDQSRYVKAPYRGNTYYASFPSAQVTAVHDLVHMLLDQFSIAKQIPPSNKRMEYDPVYFSSWKGIASHQNFRADKTDIGPAWNWDWLGI